MSVKGNHNACFICLRTPIKYPGISLHRFPSNFNQRSLWLEACGLDENDYRSSRRVCSFHFKKDCFHTTYIRKSLKPGSLPTIFTKQDFEDYKNSVLQKSELARNKSKKKKKKKKKRKIKEKAEKNIEELSKNQLFCPRTMFRYDDSPNEYKTVWVCRICLAFIFSESGVHNHLTFCNIPGDEEITNQDLPPEENQPNKSTSTTAEDSSSEFSLSCSSPEDESLSNDDTDSDSDSDSGNE